MSNIFYTERPAPCHRVACVCFLCQREKQAFKKHWSLCVCVDEHVCIHAQLRRVRKRVSPLSMPAAPLCPALSVGVSSCVWLWLASSPAVVGTLCKTTLCCRGTFPALQGPRLHIYKPACAYMGIHTQPCGTVLTHIKDGAWGKLGRSHTFTHFSSWSHCPQHSCHAPERSAHLHCDKAWPLKA